MTAASEDIGLRKVEVTVWSSVRKPLAYLVPTSLSEKELLGRRVVVPVARSRQMGVITGLDVSYGGALRRVESFPDLEPVLTERDLAICRFLSEYYFAPLGECIKTLLPRALTAKLRQNIRLISAERLQSLAANGDRQADQLLQRFSGRSRLAASAVSGIAAGKLRDLEDHGAIVLEWGVKESRRLPSEQLVTLAATEKDRGRLGPKATQVLEFIESSGECNLATLRRQLKVAPSTINSLLGRGLIALSEQPPAQRREGRPERQELHLTEEQQVAVTELVASVRAGGFYSYLLYGVTGSGKTEVYVRAIREGVRSGGQAIVIVPEIGLSQAMAQQLRESLGVRVDLIHSRLSERARLRIWQDARRGRSDVILGPRSAVFSPLPKLRLIVVDEEHDQSLKQESAAPRYHARDVALYRAKLEGCLAVLGSATPAVESYYNARRGKYRLLRLTQRVDKRPLPQVSVVDLREAFTKRAPGFITETLATGITQSLASGGQVMLLLNRRGFAPSVHCYSCGYRFTCCSCAVTLVYHKRDNVLLCHSCGRRQPYPQSCPACSSNLFFFRGIGTEKLDEELRGRFPEVEIARMDLDSTRRKGSFETMYSQFRTGEARILVGTQMIAKGFDFPDVALVGIVSADTTLELPDFRARERALQLMTQAAGRAGRQRFPGEVILQTLHPDDVTVALAAQQDYEAFYETEIRERQALGFPPFARLILVTLESEDAAWAREMSKLLASALKRVSQMPYQLLGPVAAPVMRRRSYYRHHILLKTAKVRSTLPYLERALGHKSLQNRRKLSIIVDVDAMDML